MILVSNETVVLQQHWAGGGGGVGGEWKEMFGFMNRVDKVSWSPKDLSVEVSSVSPSSNLMLETSALESLYVGELTFKDNTRNVNTRIFHLPTYLFNSVDKSKHVACLLDLWNLHRGSSKYQILLNGSLLLLIP